MFGIVPWLGPGTQGPLFCLLLSGWSSRTSKRDLDAEILVYLVLTIIGLGVLRRRSSVIFSLPLIGYKGGWMTSAWTWVSRRHRCMRLFTLQHIISKRCWIVVMWLTHLIDIGGMWVVWHVVVVDRSAGVMNKISTRNPVIRTALKISHDKTEWSEHWQEPEVDVV